ncbi:MAG TPA: STN and carboxypeptidase regulatory-like domain-containing protein, partial [Bacteroidales bacterium]
MRITFLMITGMLILFANSSYSQSTQVTLSLKNATVEEVLNEIEKKSDYYFLFNQKLVDVSRKVDINTDNKPIKDVLDELFKGQDIEYVVFDRQIILAPKEISKSMEDFQQQKITGLVTDAKSGDVLAGVSVAVEGTSLGTLSQQDGTFT